MELDIRVFSTLLLSHDSSRRTTKPWQSTGDGQVILRIEYLGMCEGNLFFVMPRDAHDRSCGRDGAAPVSSTHVQSCSRCLRSYTVSTMTRDVIFSVSFLIDSYVC